MYPLLAGSVPLPKLVLSDSGENNPEEKAFVLDQLQLNCLTKRSLPTHIYVMVSYLTTQYTYFIQFPCILNMLFAK